MQLRPSAIIASQRAVIAELEAVVDLLKGALAATGVEADVQFQPWMRNLTQQERALVGALFRRYPRPMNKFELLEAMPGQDHVVERQAHLVTIKVCHVRKKLGQAAIESVRGLGYRLGDKQYQSMRRWWGSVRPGGAPANGEPAPAR